MRIFCVVKIRLQCLIIINKEGHKEKERKEDTKRKTIEVK